MQANWNEVFITWDNTPFTWNDIKLTYFILGVGKTSRDIRKLEKDKKLKKDFITLLVKCEYFVYNETKEKKDYKISISDVNFVVDTVFNNIGISRPNIKVANKQINVSIDI